MAVNAFVFQNCSIFPYAPELVYTGRQHVYARAAVSYSAMYMLHAQAIFRPGNETMYVHV